MDARGIPTLVEVKRSSDTRSRREVVAQMLDYAAQAKTSFDPERLAEWLEESAQQRGSTAADTLLDAFGVDDVDSFWQTVETNLEAERFRLVFVSDSIGAELRRIIEFLNSQMSRTEVLAVKRPTQRERLDRETLLASIREQSALAAEGVLDWADREPRLQTRYTRTRGFIETAGQPLLKLYTARFPPKIEVRLATLANHGRRWDDEQIGQLVRNLPT